MKRILGVFFLFFSAQLLAQAGVVLEHDGVSVDRAELDYIVAGWTDQMQQSAVNDDGDRLELLNRLLVGKKLAREADRIPQDSELYWPLQYQIINLKRKYIMDNFSGALDIPDMTALAKERYVTEKEKYARVPEKRLSSHILFACPPGKCSREDTKARAQVVLDQLRDGADFEEMVQQYSDDPGTKAKGGLFDKWMARGEVAVIGPYSEGLFGIEKEGEYSDLVGTRYGVHIVRLDGIREEHYLPYDEVEADIIKALKLEYVRLAVRDYTSSLNMTDDAFIDGAVIEEVLAPYKNAVEP